ncbi:PREDICTED: fatty acid synthase-like, partial [Polistes dominula]|uniref:Fatty acid synthase-like n=1 Tax=Polistes dominula TaxID=743375 RepID=A0ABM1JBL1_POLDO
MSKIPSCLGTISSLTKFDNVSFGISTLQSNNMSPESRIAIETTFEAIIDAGINLAELRDKKINVYGVLSLYESDVNAINIKGKKDGYSLTGNCRAMLSNQISFVISLIGSSCSIDSSCTSSAVAIQKAYQAIKAGDCDNAI